MIVALMNTSALQRPDESKTLWLPSPAPFEFKFAKGDGADVENQCIVEGYASLWDAVDSGSDFVAKGAFTKSLKKRRNAVGQWLIPMYFGHVHNSVPVGVWTDIAEDSKGLKVRGPILIEGDNSRQLSAVLRAGGGMGLSIGYTTIKRKYIGPDGKEFDDWVSGGRRRLDEVDLREISFTPMPMLDSARLTSVKGEGEDEQIAPIERQEPSADELQAKALIRALGGAANSFALTHALESAARKFGR